MIALNENDSTSLDVVMATLNSGGLVCFPTETVYALACDATNAIAIEKIYNIKKRDKSKPIAIFIRDVNFASKYVEMPEDGEISGHNINNIISNMIPGPITLVCNMKNDISASFGLAKNISNNGKIGFRIPNHKFCLDLLNLYDRPIAATSANISGDASAITADEIVKSIGQYVDFIIDGGKSLIGVPSTVIDVSESPFKILRGSLS